jgi:hypothetical protein
MRIAAPSRLSDWRAAARRIGAHYRGEHGRSPNMLCPVRYSEKIQWRKLFDLDPRYAVLCDKFAARAFIASRIGDANLVPLQWHGDDADQIPFDELRPPYVLKSTHGWNNVIIVGEDEAVDRDAVRATARAWLGHCHGEASDEPAYVPIPRRLIVEDQIFSPGRTRPLERRFLVFHGEVAMIATTFFDGENLRQGAFHTPAWEWRPWYFTRQLPEETFREPPPLLAEMLRAASRLGAGFDHIRVDIYDCGDTFRVGEITIYPWSGMGVLNPDEADFQLGAAWKVRHPLARAVATMLTRPRRISLPSEI